MDLNYCVLNLHLLFCTVLIAQLCLTNGVLDRCSPNPCQNRALCRVRADGYACFCVPGFQGARCQINVNECASQPCGNRGTCVDRVGAFDCLCAPGFTGRRCELDLGPCHSGPCLNGARCRDDADGFRCTCLPGFHGDRCQTNTDECRDEPCQNGGRCRDGLNQFSCDCSLVAFSGKLCEIPLSSCRSQPCLNSALCQDTAGNYSCLCLPGFEGRQCEVDVPECSSAPCLHGGRCVERSWRRAYGEEPLLPEIYDPRGAQGFICSCPHGTTGSLCEEVLDPCSSGLCQNGGRCESSVGGFLCHCPPLYGGPQCGERLTGCEVHGCQNQGLCEPFLLQGTHGYTCLCPAGFTGPLCRTSTTFSFERSGFLLLQSPLVDTAVSANVTLSFKTVLREALLFQRNSHGLLLSLSLFSGRLRLTLSGDPAAPGLSQAGPLQAGPLQAGPLQAGPLQVGPLQAGPLQVGPFQTELLQTGPPQVRPPQVRPPQVRPPQARPPQSGPLEAGPPQARPPQSGPLEAGPPQVRPPQVRPPQARSPQARPAQARPAQAGPAQAGPPQTQVLELPQVVSDGQWHSVEAMLGDWVLSLKLQDHGERGHDERGHNERGHGEQTSHRVAPVLIPAGPVSWPQSTQVGGVRGGGAKAFLGCMRDVFVDWQLVIPERWLQSAALNVAPGCTDRDHCHDSPCHHRGHCINLRQSYSCICPRPYTGHDCEEELVAARFGHEDSQSVAVFTVTDDITENLSLSLFLRTRRQRCLLLAVSSNNTLYFTLRLEDGKVLVQLGSFGLIQSNRTVNDGEVHFVSVDLSNGTMKLDVQGEEQDHVEAGSVDVRAGDAVYVGGLWKSEQTAAFGGGLKGCVQDLRINDRRLLFFSSVDSTKEDFPLVHRENVSEGCTGDDQCSRNPCLNGGMCFSVWDDFSCSCAPSTSGRRCEEVRWCELGPCPAGAECRVLGRGYDCYSNATFLNDSTVLTFRGNGQILRNLTSLSLDLRTRKRNAAVLHAEHASSFITLSLQEGHLVLELQSDGEEEEQEEEEEEERKVSTVSISSRTVVSDGEWHHVHLFMATPWTQTSRWTLVLDQEVEAASTSRTRAGNLDFLRQGVDIFLGGLAPEAGWALAGCLSTVELGGIALSYFTSADVNLPRLQPDQFSLVSSGAPLLGCSGAPVCEPSPCLNGGLCQDLFNWFNCSCVGGWAGRRCDLYINACASQPCRHGNCSGRGLQYQCECEVGFSGQDCDLELDPCEKHLCANGATCLQGPKGYSCLCPDNYTGPLCSERVRELPWYMIVRSVRPKLPVSVCGDSLRNYTCFNGGNCTERDLSCDCLSGFTGHRCEQEVDECRSSPCLNGGYCRNLMNRFVCVCDMSFAGDVCEIDLRTKGLTSHLLLCVSLLSVVLLLLLVFTSVVLVVALNRRATRGTYSPSRQEKDGSRVEMWSITQPPPTERLI